MIAIIEVCSALAVIFLLGRWIEVTEAGSLQAQLSGWNYSSHLIMILGTLIIIRISRRRPEHYGFAINNLAPRENRELILAASYAVGIIWLVFRYLPAVDQGLRAVVMLPPGKAELNLFSNKNDLIAGYVLTLIYWFIFVGLGEDLLFRGYVQGRLNEVFEKRFKILDTWFGPGLLLASCMSGFVTGATELNPFAENFDSILAGFEWQWVFAGILEGMVLGLIRERTGSALVSGILHGIFLILFIGMDFTPRVYF